MDGTDKYNIVDNFIFELHIRDVARDRLIRHDPIPHVQSYSTHNQLPNCKIFKQNWSRRFEDYGDKQRHTDKRKVSG